MGCNYYARSNTCKYCGHSKESIHIGKSSWGWTFSFHSIDDIKSYKDWIKFLSQEGVKIYDEYQEEVSLLSFKKLVKLKVNEKNNHAKQYPKNCFLDKEGHSFDIGEFS